MLEDLQLGVCYKGGDTLEEDIKFDSKYMFDIIPKVGKAIHDAYFGVK